MAESGCMLLATKATCIINLKEQISLVGCSSRASVVFSEKVAFPEGMNLRISVVT